MRVAFVTRNLGKLRELRALLPAWELEPLDTAGIGEEIGETFYENARQKALFGLALSPPRVWVLAEDSGLEVDGLAGTPGIRSARFAGPDATDEENVEKLLAELEGKEGLGRRACYLSELVLLSPDGEEFRGTGALEGAISHERRGTGGFGYDPVFVPQGETQTVGELGDRWKAGSSHRARAVDALRAAVSGEG